MVESVEELTKRDNKSQNREYNLVLTIDQNEKIIKFNATCEKISGYTKNDALNKSFIDFLIPERFNKQWNEMLSSARKDKFIDDFKLPIMTRNGYEILISWSLFPVKNAQGSIGDIGFVGKMVTSWNDANETSIDYVNYKQKHADNYMEMNKIMNDLENKNIELKNKNTKLEKVIKKLQKEKNTPVGKNEYPEKTQTSTLGKSMYSLTDKFGSQKKRQEFERLYNELEERRLALDDRESQLYNEKRNLNEQRNEFSIWRKKLEFLEEEIYKREEYLEDKEKIIRDSLLAGADTRFSPKTVTTEDIVDFPEFLEKITDSAVVLQRGILKQVNDTFLKLIGYKTDDIIDKSIFDFIDSESFSKVESYYLDRIKGKKISTYEAIFLTKNNKKIYVEISNRPTTYNGEKAEISVIKQLKKKK